MAKVAIVLPIYDVELYLRRCLDTVTAQTLQDIEIILATDGPAACDDICQEYAQKDSRIKLIMHPGGYGLAVNKGIERATGEYIGIVETDDWLDLTMFEKLYAMAIRHNADMCKGAFYTSYDAEPKFATVYTDIPEGEFHLKDYPRILSYQPSIWSSIYKKSFLDEQDIRFMNKRISFIDTPFHLETFVKAKKIAFVNEPLYYYYQDNHTQSVKSEENILDGLESEAFFYQKYDLSHTDECIYEALLFSTTLHMVWNYKRITSRENKGIFWNSARIFLHKIMIRPLKFTEFNLKQKIFLKEILYSPYHIVCDISLTLYSILTTLLRLLGNIR